VRAKGKPPNLHFEQKVEKEMKEAFGTTKVLFFFLFYSTNKKPTTKAFFWHGCWLTLVLGRALIEYEIGCRKKGV